MSNSMDPCPVCGTIEFDASKPLDDVRIRELEAEVERLKRIIIQQACPGTRDTAVRLLRDLVEALQYQSFGRTPSVHNAESAAAKFLQDRDDILCE